VTDIEVATGEIVAAGPLTPAEVRRRSDQIQQMMRESLVRGIDYATLPHTQTPTLLKPGAEKLLFGFQLGAVCALIPDDDARQHRGVRYRCTITDRTGFTVAEREGYAGYDESRFDNGNGWRADWNNVLQMAQKRATVAATRAALAASGLFAEDDATAPAAAEPRRARPPGPRGRAERVPDYVYDDAPEARGQRPSGPANRGEAGPAGPADPDGEPF
jgi:hypothetical protein